MIYVNIALNSIAIFLSAIFMIIAYENEQHKFLQIQASILSFNLILLIFNIVSISVQVR